MFLSLPRCLSKEVGGEWAAWARVTAVFLFYRQRRDEKCSRRGWGLGTARKEQGAVASWGLRDEGRESHVSHGLGSWFRALINQPERPLFQIARLGAEMQDTGEGVWLLGPLWLDP